MKFNEAERQKAFAAEKQISSVRALVIIFSGVTFFLIENPFIKPYLAYFLIVLTWLYGGFVLYYKPHEKFPIFLASWFTYVSDGLFTTLWVYATGGFYSPYYVIYFASVIAVAFRFDFKTTIFTAGLYTIAYFFLLTLIGHIHGNESTVIVRSGFIFIIGLLTYQITKETLFQTEQKLKVQKLMSDEKKHQLQINENREKLSVLNTALQLRNNIFTHAEENAHIGSYSYNIQTGVLEYSDNLYRLLGHNPGDFIPSAEKYFSFIHPDERSHVRSEWENSLQQRATHTSLQRIITAKGELRYFRSTGKVVGEADRHFFIGTLQDVTSDVLLNEALQTKNQELERINAELESFSYVASHDLQEPVRKIHTFTELVIEKDNDHVSESSRDYLLRISNAASRMQFLIQAFLNYSHINRSDIVFESVDLNEVLKEVLDNTRELIQEKKAEFTIGDLPTLQGVPFHMQQLFTNLIGNAIKYSKADERPVVKIYADKVPGKEIEQVLPAAKPYYWRISVSDNGIGFDQQYAEKIFEVFQRLHSKDKYAGTGIGLAICKKIVQTHNGYIKATGVPGQGSVFTIYLPA
jgi:signal transduction histidine kinase